MMYSKRARFASVFRRSLGVLGLGLPVAAGAVEISNGVPEGTVGHYRVDLDTGGQTRTAFITAARFASNDIVTREVVFDYSSLVDPGNNGSGFSLLGSTPVVDPSNPRIVTSSGSFFGVNQNVISWTAVSSIAPGAQVMTTTYTFAAQTGALGPLRFLQYLDEDIQGNQDDVFFSAGSAANGDLELFTFDNTDVYGLTHFGTLLPGLDMQNASFAGWAVDRFNNMRPLIEGNGQPVSHTGIITNLQGFQHPQLGPVFGPADIVSVMAWDVDPNSSSAVIKTSLGGVLADFSADLALTKTDSDDPVTAGSNLTYTVNVTNHGPSNATGVTVTDPVPGGVSFVSATPSQGSCSGTGIVSCALGSLANGTTATVTIVVIPTSAGALSNTANVTGFPNDLNPDDDSDTETTTVGPPPPPPPPPPPAPAPLPPQVFVGGLAATIVGTEGNDTLVGTPGRDVIAGLGGNDTISGLGGNDVIDGGPGKDVIKGGAGSDALRGGSGNDKLNGGSGTDKCRGDSGRDTAKACERASGVP